MAEIILGVYRLLDDRVLPPGPEQNRLEWQRHNARRQALEELFAESTEFNILNWGNTKDESRTHEFVEVTFDVLTQVLNYAVVPGLVWLGHKLAESAVDHAVSEAVKAVVSRIRPRQTAHKVLDIIIRTPDGTTITVDPPDRHGTITVQFAEGALQSVTYTDDNGETAP